MSKVWIDLDNSPHVPLFVPIVRGLEARGHSVFLTARDCFQVCGLAEHHHLKYKRVGQHYGANRVLKVIGTIWRALQLLPTVVSERPDVSLSHGSRPLVLLSSLLRIPTILMFDYEHSQTVPFVKPALGMAPEVINEPGLAKRFKQGLRPYSGLKEDVYAASFQADPTFLEQFGVANGEIIATIRPPATEAHYHNPEAETLFVAVVDYLGAHPDVRLFILPRNEKTQRKLVFDTWPEWCASGKIIVPDKVVDGMNLVWHSDFVVSGGGTMNREAAALGVPVYSIFRGKIGAVDRYLADHARLTLIETTDDIKSKIKLAKRCRNCGADREMVALQQILAAADELIAQVAVHA